MQARIVLLDRLLARKKGIDMVLGFLVLASQEYGVRSDDMWKFMILYYGSIKNMSSAMAVFAKAQLEDILSCLFCLRCTSF